MFHFFGKAASEGLQGLATAIGRVQGIIEFALDGTILDANENFLNAMGYSLAEVKGKHHSIFVEPDYAQSAEYKAFWDKLRRGEYDAGQYRRLGKGGREVWIQASYNPILDRAGKPVKVVKFATDVTAQKQQAADSAGQLAAIGKSQGVIAFNLDGTILDANENFLRPLGYSLAEVKGKHHSIFAEPAYAQSAEYKAFWDKLRRGEYDAGQYRRIGKGGNEVWIQASYNPIMDASGRPYKVVKYATDITQQVRAAQLMKQAVDGVVAAATKGDLSRRISLDGMSGDTRALCDGLNALLDSMTTVISEIHGASDTIAAATGEISAGSLDLAQRTESQAAAIEETAASMHEITTTVKQNADNAQAANQLAAAARDTAEKGGSVVQNAVTAVSQIEESAKKIGDIVGLIDEIAFQTNLLALNASVEAARAGEAGKGFAVVAQEVRALAQRSANASKDIKALITASNAQVKTGADLVGRTGGALTDIVAAIKKVSDIVAEIAAASREQSSGLDQVNTAVTQMDELTQRNGALVEETSASAQALATQGRQLAELVRRFHLADSAAAAKTAPARPAAAKAVPTPVARTPVARPVAKAAAKPAPKPAAVAAPAAMAAAAKAAAAPAGSNDDWQEF